MQNLTLSNDVEIVLLSFDKGFSLLTSVNCFDFEPINDFNEFQKQNHKVFVDSFRLYLRQQAMIKAENKMLANIIVPNWIK